MPLSEGVNRRTFMHNDFLLVGPAGDPAGIRGMRDAAAAMARVVQSVVRAASGLLGFALDLGEFTVPDNSYQDAIDWLADLGKRIAEAVLAIDVEFSDEFKTF